MFEYTIHLIARSHRAYCIALLCVAAGASLKADDQPRGQGGVHGRVIGLAENGELLEMVAGANIEIKDQAGNVVTRTTSASDGSHRIDLSPGTYYYRLTADGYKDEDAGRGFTVQNSGARSIFNFSMTRGENDSDRQPIPLETVPIARLEGRVLEALPDGTCVGIPGAVISLRQQPKRKLVQVVAAHDAEPVETAGAYAVVLEAGSWRAAVSAAGFETLAVRDPIRIEPDATATRDFILSRIVPEAPEDQGIIVEVAARPGGTDLTPPTPIEIDIRPRGAAQPADGPIVLDGPGEVTRDLSAGGYQIVAKAEGCRAVQSGPTWVFPGRYTHVKLNLVPEAPLDRIPEQPTLPVPPDEPSIPDPLLLVQVYEGPRAAPRPLRDAVVLVRKNGQSRQEAQRGTTDVDGTLEFALDGMGDYETLVRKNDYVPNGESISIGEAGIRRIDIYLARVEVKSAPQTHPPIRNPPVKRSEPVEVTGYVTFKNSRSSTGYSAIQDARLSWVPVNRDGRQDVATATTASSGAFELTLPEGEYRVEVEPPARFIGRTETVNVRFGMQPKHFVLSESTSRPTAPRDQPVDVQGYVVVRSPNVQGGFAAVSGARLDWSPQGLRSARSRAESDRGGRFSLRLAPGRYQVQVRPPSGYRSVEQLVDVRQGMSRPRFVVQKIPTVIPELREDPPPRRPPEESRPGSNRRPAAQQLMLQVFDARTRRPMSADVRVVLGPNQFRTGRTDELGRYVANLNPGSYTVQVHRPGYRFFQQGFRIGNDAATVRAVLQPEQTNIGPEQNPGVRRPPELQVIPPGEYEIVPRQPDARRGPSELQMAPPGQYEIVPQQPAPPRRPRGRRPARAIAPRSEYDLLRLERRVQ